MSGDDNTIEFRPAPKRPKQRTGAREPFTHETWAFRQISKKYGVYVHVGVARLPPCAHCGAAPDSQAKVYLDRLPLGGFKGGLLLTANDTQPPQLQPEFPDQPEFDEADILPGS